MVQGGSTSDECITEVCTHEWSSKATDFESGRLAIDPGTTVVTDVMLAVGEINMHDAWAWAESIAEGRLSL